MPDELLLTDREPEILGLALDGLTNREIAGKLGIQVGTVRWHLKSLHAKLGDFRNPPRRPP